MTAKRHEVVVGGRGGKGQKERKGGQKGNVGGNNQRARATLRQSKEKKRNAANGRCTQEKNRTVNSNENVKEVKAKLLEVAQPPKREEGSTFGRRATVQP